MKSLRPYDRGVLLDAIELHLAHAPSVETHKRKRLRNLTPPFEAVAPIWQLRIGAFRVFYDVNEEARRIDIRAIRKKPAHFTTEEIL